MNYEMEELVPIVGKLAEKYTGYESTSITYEKAEQLMGAVVYCIHEAEGRKKNLPARQEKIPARQMYDIGAACVREKTGEALRWYNEMLTCFESYENRCLYETFVEGLPEFFRRYDSLFKPQNTIVALDYPVLRDISRLMGIDKVYEFVACVRLEQRFLGVFPKAYVRDILSRYSSQYRDMAENLCEIVLMAVMAHILAGRSLSELTLEEGDYEAIGRILAEMDPDEMEKEMKGKLRAIVKEYFGNEEELGEYLSGAVGGNLLRLKNGAVHGGLSEMV